MDRNVVIATVLIALIMVVWLTWLTPPPPVEGVSAAGDSTQVVGPDTAAAPERPEPFIRPPRLNQPLTPDSTVFGAATGEVRTIRVENDLYEATFSTRGASPTSWLLHTYQKAGGGAVQMVDSLQMGALAAVFTSPSNRVYDTRQFVFQSDAPDVITVGDAGASLSFTTAAGEGSLRYTYSFEQGSYEMKLAIETVDAASFATQSGYELVWNGAIPFTEHDREDESRRSGAFASSGGEVEQVDLTSEPYAERSIRGAVDWTVVKSKYFLVAIMPEGPARDAELVGERFGETADSTHTQVYSASLGLPLPVAGQADLFTLYVGPLEFRRINAYDVGLYDVVDYGWDFFETVTRPLAKFIFIPVFTYLGSVLPNYGWVIIILSLLIKLLVYPLTKSSFKSMAKMRDLQPKMEAIKEKYADNPQKQQEATMRMYKETGVNPLGGCLPMLLQYPIIIALWQYLPQSIQIRQQGFLWAADLSAPDVLFHLPFTVPFLGDFLSGFTILMSLSMIVQMRMSTNPSSNPQAKIMMYVFPVMLFVIFNRFASGLNLYYLCYNVLTAGQQQLINRQLKREKAAEAEAMPAKTAWEASANGKKKKKPASKR